MSVLLAKFDVLRLSARPVVVRRVVVAVFVFAVFAVSGSVVRASCGDWLAKPGHMMPGSLADGVTAPMGQVVPPNLADRYPVPVPCNGPQCHKAPDAPVPPVPVTVLERTDKLGIAVQSADELQLRQFGLSPEWDARPAKGFLPRIEHPPRA